MTDPLQVLLVEDSPGDARLVQEYLADGDDRPTRIRCEASLAEGLQALTEMEPDVVLLDLGLPDSQGLDGPHRIADAAPGTPVVVLTGLDDTEIAYSAMANGVQDFLVKGDITPRSLRRSIRYAVERARSDQALQESEEQFRSLLETAPDAIVVTDRDGFIQLWNGVAEEMFGYPSGQAVGQSVLELMPERVRAAHRESLRRWHSHLDGGGAPIHGIDTTTGLRQDGSEFPVEVSLSSRGANGAITFTAVIRDISDRVETREALEALSRRHELLLNSAGEGIVGLDPDGRVTFVNPAALEILGTMHPDLLGRPLCTALPACGFEDSKHGPECPIHASLKSQIPVKGELEIGATHGRTAVDATCAPILDGGTVAGAVMVFADISARREHERALRESERRYREVVENAPYGIYRSKSDGSLLMANPALAKMLGYGSVRELLATDMEDLYVDGAERARAIARHEDSDNIEEEVLEWRRRDGQVITVRARGRAVRERDGEIGAWEMMVEDLTERRALESQLRQAQKMEAVGQLTGGIAHDFNNMLAVILMTTELVAEAAEDGEPIDLDDLNVIRDAGRRAQNITSKLLGFSRQADLVRQTTELSRLLHEVLPILEALVPETLVLETRVQKGAAPVLVDPGSMEQMLVNLVANSRDATPDGGRITVAVAETDLDEDSLPLAAMEPGTYTYLEVSDTGSGMTDEALQRVFEPFFTTKDAGSGTGLGMAMVYGLTKQQGGYVTVDSEIGRGTTTRLYFPAHHGERTATRRIPLREATVATATILVVEDDDNLRTVTQRALEKAGHRVLTAPDGETALRTFEDHQLEIDLVLSDLVLPGLGGARLLERIREEHGPVRFVLSSGYSAGDAGVGDRLGPDTPFLQKPWNVRDLLQVIQAALEMEPVNE